MRFAFDDFVLDTAVFELRKHGELRALQPKPLDLLRYLVVNRDRVVLKKELLAHLWPDVRVTENALAQAIACVREALADANEPAIVGVRGRGYRFALAVSEMRDEQTAAVERRTGFVVDARTPADLDLVLRAMEMGGARVVRIVARSHAPLASIRALLHAHAEMHPNAAVAGAPLSHAIAAATEDHAVVDLAVALFGEPAHAPSVLVLESLERADIASVLLFSHIASMPRKGLSLAGTCAWTELAPHSAAMKLLSPLAFPPGSREAPRYSVSVVARNARNLNDAPPAILERAR